MSLGLGQLQYMFSKFRLGEGVLVSRHGLNVDNCLWTGVDRYLVCDRVFPSNRDLCTPNTADFQCRTVRYNNRMNSSAGWSCD